jgi:hypothetical protein
MPDALDPVRLIEARPDRRYGVGLDAVSGPSSAEWVGRFRLDLRNGHWEWSGDGPPHPAELLADRHPEDRPEASVVALPLAEGRPFGTGFRLMSSVERQVIVVGEGERAPDGEVVALTATSRSSTASSAGGPGCVSRPRAC